MNGRKVCYLQSKGSAAAEQVATDNAAFALQGASIAERSPLDCATWIVVAPITRAHLPTSRSSRRRRYRSEEHTSELQSLMRISYAVFCLKKKTISRHKK